MVNPAEGTFIGVLRLDEPWPPIHRSRLLEIQRGSACLQLHAEPRGALVFSVGLQESRIEYKTQTIAISKPGWTVLCARWSSGGIDIQLNGHTLLPYEAAGGDSQLIETTEHPSGTTPSWSDPSSASQCEEWVNWRADKFGRGDPPPKPGRRSKSYEEQRSELRRSARILNDLATLVQQGHSHLLGHLATELRALIYWNGRNYSPLLLRLAAKAKAPLPVYMIRESKRLPVTDGLVGDIRRGEPSILRTWPTQELGDLQEWLESEVLSERIAASSNFIELNVKGVIAGVADSLGAAHYDPDMPIAIENLGNVRGPVTDEITVILLLAAALIVPLSQYIDAVSGPPPNTR